MRDHLRILPEKNEAASLGGSEEGSDPLGSSPSPKLLSPEIIGTVKSNRVGISPVIEVASGLIRYSFASAHWKYWAKGSLSSVPQFAKPTFDSSA